MVIIILVDVGWCRCEGCIHVGVGRCRCVGVGVCRCRCAGSIGMDEVE